MDINQSSCIIILFDDYDYVIYMLPLVLALANLISGTATGQNKRKWKEIMY